MDGRMSATYRDALRAALLYLVLSVVWLPVEWLFIEQFLR